jgi:hypothetical protein
MAATQVASPLVAALPGQIRTAQVERSGPAHQPFDTAAMSLECFCIEVLARTVQGVPVLQPCFWDSPHLVQWAGVSCKVLVHEGASRLPSVVVMHTQRRYLCILQRRKP